MPPVSRLLGEPSLVPHTATSVRTSALPPVDGSVLPAGGIFATRIASAKVVPESQAYTRASLPLHCSSRVAHVTQSPGV